jgi:hypothetical protein
MLEKNVVTYIYNKMYIPSEIIVLFFLISFLIYTMPMVLVKFSKTTKGKFLLLVLMVVMTLYNRTAGMIMALFYIFLSEMNYEFNNEIIYEGFSESITEEPEDKLSIEEGLRACDSSPSL